MIQALTPGQFSTDTSVVSVVLILIGLPLIICGSAEVAGWVRRIWRRP